MSVQRFKDGDFVEDAAHRGTVRRGKAQVSGGEVGGQGARAFSSEE